MNANALYMITKVHTYLMERGEVEAAMPVELFYKRYSHARPLDKHKVFEDFIDYCLECGINIREDLNTDEKAA